MTANADLLLEPSLKLPIRVGILGEIAEMSWRSVSACGILLAVRPIGREVWREG
jgi:hypothetical protein